MASAGSPVLILYLRLAPDSRAYPTWLAASLIIPIYPPLDGITAERFPVFARALALAQSPWDRDRVRRLLDDEIAWCAGGGVSGEQKLIYEASIRVFADLARLRWRIVEQGYGFALANPKEPRRSLQQAELIATKNSLREELSPVVEEQIANPSVKGFLRKMEREWRSQRSVLKLQADPQEVAKRLESATKLSGEARERAVADAVRPYLQRVDDGLDHVTGRTLREIWRYFRYSWSIPQVSIPGRQILYLVRDAGHPDHPVMGIAALNNCALEMGETRETYIGWHRNAVEARFDEARLKGATALIEEVEWIEGRIEASLAEVDWTNLVTAAEVAAPTARVIARLQRRAQGFGQLREELLRGDSPNSGDAALDDEENGIPPVDDEVLWLEPRASANDRMHAARRHLVAKKRATALARLLAARLAVAKSKRSLTDPSQVQDAIAKDDVRNALNIVMDALKGRRAGANMLEITTCGAIWPYGSLLGGKLVALLMLSPEVAADYRSQYDSPSIISSQMLNKPVVRNNVLAYLGTTSLYVHGSSQYNRLSLPAGVIADGQECIRFMRVGETTGFGTVQFSPDTSKAIDAYLTSKHSYREVNGVFGEGTSPKLRKMKTGLRAIGFDPDRMIEHKHRRLIYSAPLWAGACDWLTERGVETPPYVAEPERFRDATQRIADFWSTRWLCSRIDHEPTMEALRRAHPRVGYTESADVTESAA